MGSRILPKSRKIAPGRRSIRMPFSGLRVDWFWRRFCSQNRLPNRRFLSPESGTALLGQNPKILETVLHFLTFFEGPGPRKSIKNRSKNDRKTKLDSRPVSDPVLGRFSDDFGIPKRRKNGRESKCLGFRKRKVLRRLWNPNRRTPSRRGSGAFHYPTGYAYD